MSNKQPTTAVNIVGGPAASLRVPLLWTYEFEGKTYNSISIKRLRVREVAKMMSDVRAAQAVDPNASVRMPIYVDDAGEPIPDAFIEELFDDDMVLIEKAASDFFPRRFRASAEDASRSATGDDTGATSSA